VRYACEDLETLWQRLDTDVAAKLREHHVGKLLTTIGGIGDHTAAMLITELGDPGRFESAAALAAYVGLCPGHKHSGKHQPKSFVTYPVREPPDQTGTMDADPERGYSPQSLADDILSPPDRAR
jgi:hypothetical protein